MAGAVLTAERTETDLRSDVLGALRGLRGRATVADIVAATGLVPASAEATLRGLLATHTGHVEVGERGDLVYAFEPRLLTRDHVPWWRRAWGALKRAAKVAFKAWIAVTLVAYFLLFLVLAVAAIVVALAKGGDDVDIDIRGGGRGLRLDWLWFLFWAPDFRWGAPYYGRRWERLHGRRRRVPFYKKVFAFVFGPDEPRVPPEERERGLVSLIRARGGVLTAADLMLFTGATPETAHEELGRLLGAHDGEAHATPEGEVAYLFPSLMVSAHGPVTAEGPPPAWHRLQPIRALTGNSAGANAAIIAINAFNLAGVAGAAGFIMPTLGFGGPVAWTGLVWFPLAFSALFFAIPLVRMAGVARENERRRRANARRVALGPVFEAALAGEPLAEVTAIRHVRAALEGTAAPSEAQAREALRRITAELEGDVEIDATGATHYRFPGLRRQIEAGNGVRRAERLEDRRVGAVVYSSADDEETAARRELDTFDRDLRRALLRSGTGYEDDAPPSEARPAAAPPDRPRRGRIPR